MLVFVACAAVLLSMVAYLEEGYIMYVMDILHYACTVCAAFD